MTKKWKTTVQDKDEEVVLYTITGKESIRRDLGAGKSGSFILNVRCDSRRAETTEEADHADLAAGAFAHHRDIRKYTQSNPEILLVDEIPVGLMPFHLGGHANDGYMQYAITVYESRIGIEQDAGLKDVPS